MLKRVQHDVTGGCEGIARQCGAVLLVMALAACSRQAGEPSGEPIDCALGAATKMARVCKLETRGTGNAREFVVHHPDGGFRRFLGDGAGGLTAADGAEAARVRMSGQSVEIVLGGNRYRFEAALVGWGDER
jgi:hypothetical protein